MAEAANIAVVGAGFAGLTAAHNLASKGCKVTVFESFPSSGKKVLATGGGRCNITNTLSPKEFIARFHSGKEKKFISFAIEKFSPSKLVHFLEKNGLKTVCSDGFHVFPQSQKAQDVVNLFYSLCQANGVRFKFNSCVSSIERKDGGFIVCCQKEATFFEKVIIATGGLSSPNKFDTTMHTILKSFGHTIENCYPGLCEVECNSVVLKNLAGTVIKKASVTIDYYTSTGEFLITHRGVSGPSAINCASLVAKSIGTASKPNFFVDFLPDISTDELENTFITDSQSKGGKTVAGWLSGFLSKNLSKNIIESLSIDLSIHLSKISSVQRKLLIKKIKHCLLEPVKTAGFGSAMVTSGGVSTDEINNKTMESKLIKNLFFAGEVIDIDGPCGGFNLQWAYSSAMCIL